MPSIRRAWSRSAFRLRAVVLVSLVAVGGCAAPATTLIRGVVHVPGTAAGGVRNAVVFVDSLAGSTLAKMPDGPLQARLVHRDSRLVPEVLAVARGTTVAIENQDRIYHDVFSVSETKKFDTGTYGPGETRAVTFDRVGTVPLFCGLHPATSGTVFVVPYAVFAQPDATGRFALPKLPRGRYVVRVWHPGYGERTRAVLPTKTGVADVRFDL